MLLAAAGTQASEIIEAAGVRGGLVVHVGCGDGKLTAALRVNERYVVHGLDTDPANVAKARKYIQSRGLYGPVSVERFDGRHLPYTDDLVNLVVVGEGSEVAMKEIMRVLAPLGVAYGGGAKTRTITKKPWPKDIDEWTHYLHGSDNNAVARDTRVGPPRHLRWTGPPLWCRSHDGAGSSVALVLSAKGRLFSVIDEGLTGQPGLPERWTLVARDAFNGTLLWKKRLSRRVSQKALVAAGERLYLTGGGANLLTILDAATGKTLRTCKGTERADEVVCVDGVVVVHVGSSRRGKAGQGKAIVALAADGGRVLWRTPAKSMVRESLAATDGRVCYHSGKEIVCLSLADGKAIWRTPCGGGGRGGTLMIYRGVVLVTASGGLRAFSAETGKALWKGPGVHRRLGMFGAGGLIWLTDIQERGRTFLWTPAPVVTRGHDPQTGQVKRTVTVPRVITPGHHIRCYSAKATERYLLLPKRGVEFVDLQGSNHMQNDWLRGPCRHGVIAANGLLYAPPHQCFCYPGVKVTGYNAVSAGLVKQDRPAKPRLERGKAYGKISNLKAQISEGDWPTYRHDARRSGRAGCELPDKLTRLWQRKLGGRVAQPIVAGGRLFLAEEEAHTVRCLDAADGKELWSYTAGGRIDSAPTFHRGLVLFGSTDGWVYCLRAADGELAWRFRAAPQERRIVAHSRLESAWPVHGSVLVQNGVAYCTAGRSSYLDGGIWVYGLDPATGKVVHETRLTSPRPDATRDAGRPFDMEGARTDILVSDGTDLYMFFTRFAADLKREPTPRITKLGDREVSLHLMSNAGFLDKSWFDRNYWTYSRRWPGYYFGYNAPKTGQILVFDDTTTYGLHVFTTRQGHSPRFWPGKDGYELFADSNDNRPVLRPTAIGREKGNGYSRMLPPKWSARIPVRVGGLVLAGKRLYLAGSPDVLPEDDPYAAIEGRKGGRLWVVSTADGKRLAEHKLGSMPVFDGMVAAGGRLYVATVDGHLICMGAKK